MANIQENVSLSDFTTFRLGGPARFFAEVENKKDLEEALQFAKEKKIEWFVLGGGSNLLVSDQGFNGLVIKIKLNNFKIDLQQGIIHIDAGVNLAKLVDISIFEGLTGMEWAAGIPGTVGGAIRGNARAFGKNMGIAIETVEALDINGLKINSYNKSECEFEYWGSIFKKNPNLIIVSAKIKLKKGHKEKSQQEVRDIINKRISAQPTENSPGSFFLNPVIKDKKLIEQFEKDQGIKSRGGKVPAGWLIDQLGLRGQKIGGAMVSLEHANFIINTGNAKSEDVIILASLIKQKVRNNFGVQLEEEVQFVGF